MSEVVLKDVHDGVALLTLNRPERLNAWTHEMENHYFGSLAECAASDQVRVIVVTGAGRGFCAGADMQDLQNLGDLQRADTAESRSGNGTASRATAMPERTPQTFPLTIPKPIIAAINGPCAGIGLVQALMCDIRFVAKGAKLTTAFARRGLVAEHGISWILPRLVGPARALDLLFSARVLLGGEAAELGLANHAIADEELLEQAMSYARELATQCSPASMATIKQQVYAALDQSLGEALDEADAAMLASFGKPDFVEGVASFVERRDPAFAALIG